MMRFFGCDLYAQNWWLRSAHAASATNFMNVNNNGNSNNNNAANGWFWCVGFLQSRPSSESESREKRREGEHNHPVEHTGKYTV